LSGEPPKIGEKLRKIMIKMAKINKK